MAKRIRREPGREPFILTRVRDLDKQVVPDGEIVPDFLLGSARPGRKFLVVTTADSDDPTLAFYGPFETSRLATDWAHEHIPVRGNRWRVAPVDAPDPA
jgi:hypothetical protein